MRLRHAQRSVLNCGCVPGVRGTIPKLIADHARTLPVSQALWRQNFSNNHLFGEKSECRFQPKRQRRSELGNAQPKVDRKQRSENHHLKMR
jgi:hypothetical protein